jgi:hypothetical protein
MVTLASASVDRPQLENEKSSAFILKPLSMHIFPSPSSGASKSVQWDAIWVTSDSTVEFVVGGLAEKVAHAERKTDAMMSPRK